MTRDEQWLLDEKYGGTRTAAFEADRERLTAGEPLAYVIGSQPFLGLTIHLDSRPLIPRSETEWWVEQLLNSLERRSSGDAIFGALRSATARAGGNSPAGEYSVPKNRVARTEPFTRILDLCAGSGAIGCAALARLPDARVFFGELDPAHETTIRKNILENGLDESRGPLEARTKGAPGVLDALPLTGRADIRIGDLFAPFAGERFDVIAANPPYVPEHRVLDRSVADYEPPEALFAGDDGLALIRRIADELSAHLTPGGEAWIEVDRTHAVRARELFAAQGFTALIRTDQYGRPRVIVVSCP